MQTFGSRRGPISIFFFFHKCIIIVGYILKCWEIFRKAEANENITFLAFKSFAGTERNGKKSLALRMTGPDLDVNTSFAEEILFFPLL